MGRSDRLALSGFDAAPPRLFVHLVTGAALPDEGDVSVDGHNTRDIATDTEWLASLDRFGIVTERAVLIDALPIAANLALPLTLAIDPMPEDVRASVEALAARVGLRAERLGDAGRDAHGRGTRARASGARAGARAAGAPARASDRAALGPVGVH